MYTNKSGKLKSYYIYYEEHNMSHKNIYVVVHRFQEYGLSSSNLCCCKQFDLFITTTSHNSFLLPIVYVSLSKV
uniref:Putative ovule protein n=1 Tax=Solanum chacoense TaxID=4108 RepID=A0A0V0GRP3_SOLCH